MTTQKQKYTNMELICSIELTGNSLKMREKKQQHI